MGYLEEMVADVRLRGLRPATARLYSDNLRQVQLFFGERSLADLDYEDLRGYLIHIEQEGRLSVGTRRMRVSSLRALYRYTLGGYPNPRLNHVPGSRDFRNRSATDRDRGLVERPARFGTLVHGYRVCATARVAASESC
jgi:Phage integrase, N-terminal SAM-like domain